jgi:HAD superfamily hydrolase (TIGR01509 family)
MKAVLFDFGGTLDTGGVHWSEVYRELYKRFGVQLMPGELDRAFVWSEQQLLLDKEIPAGTFRRTLDTQLALQFTFLKIEGKSDLRAQMLEHCYRDVAAVASKAGVMLGNAHRKFKLGVVSNFYGNLSIVCGELGLAEHFDVMVDSARVGLRKPDPEIFRFATVKLSVAPEETFVVGDSYERDIVPAKTIGCRTIWLRVSSWTTPPSTGSADYTIQNLEEVTPILSSH